jgi:MFS superfamily sulfate permease-like transporter
LINEVALAIGVAALAFIVVAGRLVPRLPAILIAVVVATSVSAVASLAEVAEIPVVGALPRGLPGLSVPSIPIGSIGPLLAGGVAIALVSMADTSVLSRSVAARRGERSHPNKELSRRAVVQRRPPTW